MNPFRLFQPGQNPWANGLRLALLNGALAVFSAISFLGVLYLISWINQLRYASGAISTLILFAGMICVGLICLTSSATDNPSSTAPISASR